MKKVFMFLAVILTVSLCYADITAWKKLVPGKKYSEEEMKIIIDGFDDYSIKGGMIKDLWVTLTPLSLVNEIDDYEVPKVYKDSVRTLFMGASEKGTDVICLDLRVSDIATGDSSILVLGDDAEGVSIFAYMGSQDKEWCLFKVQNLDVGYWDIVDKTPYFYNKNTKRLYSLVTLLGKGLIFEYQEEFENPEIHQGRFGEEKNPWVVDHDASGKNVLKSIKIYELSMSPYIP